MVHVIASVTWQCRQWSGSLSVTAHSQWRPVFRFAISLRQEVAHKVIGSLERSAESPAVPTDDWIHRTGNPDQEARCCSGRWVVGWWRLEWHFRPTTLPAHVAHWWTKPVQRQQGRDQHFKHGPPRSSRIRKPNANKQFIPFNRRLLADGFIGDFHQLLRSHTSTKPDWRTYIQSAHLPPLKNTMRLLIVG